MCIVLLMLLFLYLSALYNDMCYYLYCIINVTCHCDHVNVEDYQCIDIRSVYRIAPNFCGSNFMTLLKIPGMEIFVIKFHDYKIFCNYLCATARVWCRPTHNCTWVA